MFDKAHRASLQSAAGFKIDVFADEGRSGRSATSSKGRTVTSFAADTTANTITILRDTDNDGKADERHLFAEGLTRPFGMAVANGYFYVWQHDSVVRWKYAPGQLKAEGRPRS
jgi:glucose/arabinose dehydrogenase